MTMAEEIDKQINEIMDWFDFEKVHKTMVALDWKWMGVDCIPMVGDIRAKAREMLNRLKEDRASCTSSGGFRAKIEQGIDDGGTWVLVTLEFIVAGWGDDGEYYND